MELTSTLDDVFGALSDPIRRGIIQRLAAGSATVSELAEPYDVTLPAIMRHVRVLETAGLLESRKEGRQRRCRISREPLYEAMAWIALYGRFWEERLDLIAELLSGPSASEAQ
jgi:DNA-binding transcriptional ArsR family regulator